MVPRVRGQSEVPTLYGMRPVEAIHETGDFAEYETTIDQGDFLTQDLSLGGNHAARPALMAFQDCYLADQETRVRCFHEVNDYLEGRR